MFRYAQILNNKVHWLYGSDKTLKELYTDMFSPDIVFIDITQLPNVCEGWNYTGNSFSDPNLVSIEDAQKEKLQSISDIAVGKYVGGFYSAALGDKWYYDSAEEDQTLIEGLYNRSKEVDWNDIERFPGICPAGYAPIRVRKNSDTLNSAKVIKAHSQEQLIQLGRDLERHLFFIKAIHWKLQEQINAAKKVDEINAIEWPDTAE